MSTLVSVEADGGRFLAETRGDHIHSSRLAALNDNVVSSLLADQSSDEIGYAALGALGAKAALGFGGEKLRRAKGDLSCGHLVFCDETGLQAFTAVSMCVYFALAKTAVDHMTVVARSGSERAPLRAASEIGQWGLYPQTERVVLMIAFADYRPPESIMGLAVKAGWTGGAVPYYANPSIDAPWFGPLNAYLDASVKANAVDPTGQEEAKGAYGVPRHPTLGWKVDYWIDALNQIVVMNRKTTETPDDQQRMADAFNGSVARDDDGHIIIDTAPRYNVLIANMIAYEGIDLQARTCALHHLDLPWEPATFTQRNGRAVRQGNVLEGVAIYAYLTEGTVDFYKLGRLEGRRQWLESILSSTGGADASIGGMSSEDRDEITLQCTLPDDRPEVAKRLKEQRAALRERTLVRDFVSNRGSCRGLIHPASFWQMPLVMDPRDAFIHRGVDNVEVTNAPAMMGELEAQRIALNGMTNTDPTSSIPAFKAMKATAFVGTTPPFESLGKTGGMVEAFTGGGFFFIPETLAVYDEDDPQGMEPEQIEEAAASIVTSFCEGGVLQYMRKDGTETKLWIGFVGWAGASWDFKNRTPLVYLPVMRNGVIYGWRRQDPERVTTAILRQLDPTVLPVIHAQVAPEDAEAPKTASGVGAFVASLVSTRTSESGWMGFSEATDGERWYEMFGVRWYVPKGKPTTTKSGSQDLHLTYAPPKWLEFHRSGLRAAVMATMWEGVTAPHLNRAFTFGSTDTSQDFTPTVLELFSVKVQDDGASVVSSRPWIGRKDQKKSNTGLSAIPLVRRISDNTFATWTDLTAEPGAHVVEWRSRVITPEVIDASVVLGLLFLRYELLHEADTAPAFNEADYDPGPATYVRARLEGAGDDTDPVTLLAAGSPARALYDSASVSKEGVWFDSVGRLDPNTGFVTPVAWKSVDAFLDAFRDPDNNDIIIDGWPVPRFVRPLLPGVFSDIRDYVTLVRGGRPAPGAAKDAVTRGYGELAWWGAAKWASEVLLMGSPYAHAQAEEERRRREREAKEWQQQREQQAQGHIFQGHGGTRGIWPRILLDWFQAAKKEGRSPKRVVLQWNDKLWLPLEVTPHPTSADEVMVDMVPIRRGPGFGQDKAAFLRYVEQMGGSGVYKDLHTGNPGVQMDPNERQKIAFNEATSIPIVGK